MKKNNEINIFSSPHQLFEFAAKDFEQHAIAAINEHGIFSVVLAGGNTPKLFFDALTSTEYYKENIPWRQINFFFGDERFVPSNDINNNYHMAKEYLFSKVPVNSDHIYPISTTFNDPNDAAKNYEQILRKAFRIKDNDFPQFDLVYLGLGDNAHTASLMPLSDVVKNQIENPSPDKNHQLAAALFVSESNMYRITLTPNAINHGKEIIFLVTGTEKATAVQQVLEDQADPLHYPAQLIHSMYGKTIWYLDQEAAKKLNLTDINDE